MFVKGAPLQQAVGPGTTYIDILREDCLDYDGNPMFADGQSVMVFDSNRHSEYLAVTTVEDLQYHKNWAMSDDCLIGYTSDKTDFVIEFCLGCLDQVRQSSEPW